MKEIEKEIFDLIKRLYPDNHYNGNYTIESKPKWINYNSKRIIESIINTIQNKCHIKVICHCDQSFNYINDIYNSSYPLGICEPDEILGQYNSPIIADILMKLGKENGFELTPEISILAPYSTPLIWTILKVEDKTIRFIDSISSPTERCLQIQKCFEKVFYDHDIKIIPLDILKKTIPGMSGYTHIGEEPTVYNCLFRDGGNPL